MLPPWATSQAGGGEAVRAPALSHACSVKHVALVRLTWDPYAFLRKPRWQLSLVGGFPSLCS